MLLTWLILLVVAALAETPATPAKPGVKQIIDDTEGLKQLIDIRRVYVDALTGGAAADQMRDLIITSLQGSKLFVITENVERADAVLRGTADDRVFTDTFSSSDGIRAMTSIGAGRSGTQRTTGTRGGTGASVSVSDRESTQIKERKHEAMASLRLVNKDGDVIWSTTQESLGAKFRGASADVADKVTKQLAADYERGKKLKRLE